MSKRRAKPDILRVDKCFHGQRWMIMHVPTGCAVISRGGYFKRKRDAVACVTELRTLDDLNRIVPRLSRELYNQVCDIANKYGVIL